MHTNSLYGSLSLSLQPPPFPLCWPVSFTNYHRRIMHFSCSQKRFVYVCVGCCWSCWRCSLCCCYGSGWSKRRYTIFAYSSAWIWTNGSAASASGWLWMSGWWWILSRVGLAPQKLRTHWSNIFVTFWCYRPPPATNQLHCCLVVLFAIANTIHSLTFTISYFSWAI